MIIPCLVFTVLIFSACGNLKKLEASKYKISMLKGNVVWVGLHNPIEVLNFDSSRHELSLEPAGVGKVVMTSYGLAIRVAKPYKGYLKLTAKHKRNGSILSEFSCSVKEIPNPELSLSYKTGPFISVDELKAVRKVSSAVKNFPFEGLRYTILGYEYSFISNNKVSVSGTSQSSVLDGNLKARFLTAKPGDMLIISNVQAALVNLDIPPRTLPNALVLHVN